MTLRANVPSTLHQAGQAGDIVMIAPAAFQSALAPLKAFREGQGYTVRLVDIEDVYDEFSLAGRRRTRSAISSSARPGTGARRHVSCSSSGTRRRIRATTTASERLTTCR